MEQGVLNHILLLLEWNAASEQNYAPCWALRAELGFSFFLIKKTPFPSTMLLPPSELCVPGPRRNLCTPEAYAFVSEGLYHKFGGSNGMAWVNPLVIRVQKILFSYLSGSETNTFSNPQQRKKERKSCCSHRSSIDRWHFPGERMECYMQKDRCPYWCSQQWRKLSLLLWNLAMAIKKVRRCGSEVD